MNARQLIEAESPKVLFPKLGSRQFPIHRLTPDEQERLGKILSMGPIPFRPGDKRFMDWGYVVPYDGDPQVVVAAPDFTEFYSKTSGFGHFGDRWRDVPYQRRAKKIHTYYWPESRHVIEQFASVAHPE